MKKTVNILSIAIIAVVLVQLIMLFIPTWTLTAAATKKVPDPQPVDYSVMSLCFTDTEDMGKMFKKIVEDYDVNTNCVGMVVTFIFGVLTIVLNCLRFVNDRSGFQTASATLIRFLMHVGTFVWAYYGITAFAESQVIPLGAAMVPTVSNIAFVVGAVLGLARLVVAFAPKFTAKKAAA